MPIDSSPPTRRRIPFRIALLTLAVGLVLLAVPTVTSGRSVKDLQSRYFLATSQATAARVRLFLDPALAVLQDVRAQIVDGRVDVGDEADLTRYLAGRLRHPGWLSFSDHATG